MQDKKIHTQFIQKIKKIVESNPPVKLPEVNFDHKIYHNPIIDSIATFSDELTKVSGQYIYFDHLNELKSNFTQLIDTKKWDNIFCKEPFIQNILSELNISYHSDESHFYETQTGITLCEFLIARFGTIMVSSKSASGRRLHVYPEKHVVIAFTSQMVNEISEAYTNILKKYQSEPPSLISLITGPSRTADIEKTLVLGAHGPKELCVILVNDKK